MDSGGFLLFIALSVSGIVLLSLTILVKSYRKIFAILLAINVVALLLLGGWLYKVYWLDEPLPGFAASGDLKRVQELLDRGADPNSNGIDGVERAIVAAAASGNAEIVALLIKKGANVNLTDGNGRTALDVATQKGFTNIVSLLTNSHALKKVEKQK
jgi:hypothetical protein